MKNNIIIILIFSIFIFEEVNKVLDEKILFILFGMIE